MSEAALTHMLTAYGPMALVTAAAFRIGHLLGRRFVRKDRPRWAPHLPPLPAKPTNPISFLLDAAAVMIAGYLAVGIIMYISDFLSHESHKSLAGEFAALLLWVLVFGLVGRYWASRDHDDAVHQHRYATDPAYRAEYEQELAARADRHQALLRAAKKREKLRQQSEESYLVHRRLHGDYP